MDDNTSDIISTINQAKTSIQGTRGYNLEHIVYYIKQAELNQTDILHELIDRMRFVTNRILKLEEGLGGYVDDSQTYSSYTTEKIPFASSSGQAAVEEENEETPPAAQEV